jgi:hypothetical protein
MRVSRFRTLVEEEFGGPYGRLLLRDHVLVALGGRTPEQALADGEEPRAVWVALCEDLDVPKAHRWGRPLRPGQPGYVPPDAATSTQHGMRQRRSGVSE